MISRPAIMRIWFAPVFSSLLQQREMVKVLMGFVGLHMTLVSLGLPSWQCPFRVVLTIPCPGCGLSRAVLCLFHGDWERAIAIHAFAPLVVLVIGFMLLSIVLSPPQHSQIAHRIAKLETQTGLSATLITGFMMYWLIRLFMFRELLFHLVL